MADHLRTQIRQIRPEQSWRLHVADGRRMPGEQLRFTAPKGPQGPRHGAGSGHFVQHGRA